MHALVVFNGCLRSGGLAGDFAKTSKEFIANGFKPKCLSNLDLHQMMRVHQGPMLHGRDEMSAREEIYIWNEPPFYELVHGGMKRRVLDWVRDTASVIEQNDRMVIVIATHGSRQGSIVFRSGQTMESMNVEEFYDELQALPQNVRVLFASLACFAGSWKKLARLGGCRDAIVELSSSADQMSINHRSGSAWIQELNKFPDGNIVRHTKRIRVEMKHAPANQTSSTPKFAFSHFFIRKKPMTHFLNSPTIVQAVLSASTFEEREKERKEMLSRIRTDSRAKRYWNRFADSLGFGDHTSNELDDGVREIRSYLRELGSETNAGNRVDLVSACYDVLGGDGGETLKQQTLNTIVWQHCQMTLVEATLKYLKQEGLIGTILSQKKMARIYAHELDGLSRKTFLAVQNRLWEITCIRDLLHSSGDDKVSVIFPDGYDLLLHNVMFNHRDAPTLERIACAIEEFMSPSTVVPSSSAVAASSSVVLPSSCVVTARNDL